MFKIEAKPDKNSLITTHETKAQNIRNSLYLCGNFWRLHKVSWL